MLAHFWRAKAQNPLFEMEKTARLSQPISVHKITKTLKHLYNHPRKESFHNMRYFKHQIPESTTLSEVFLHFLTHLKILMHSSQGHEHGQVEVSAPFSTHFITSYFSLHRFFRPLGFTYFIHRPFTVLEDTFTHSHGKLNTLIHNSSLLGEPLSYGYKIFSIFSPGCTCNLKVCASPRG